MMEAFDSFTLEALTAERKEQAFKKAILGANIPGCRLVLVKDDNYAAATKFMKEIFCRDDPVSKAVGLVSTWGPETDALWKAVFSEHLSIMLTSEETGEVIGMRATATGKKGVVAEADKFTEYGTKALLELFNSVADEAKFFEHFSVTEQIHFMGLGIHDKYRQQGLGSKLMAVAMAMVKHLGFKSVPLQVEGTSNYSKRIFEKTGFELLREVKYDEYVVDGKQVVCNTGEHKSIKLYGLCLKND